MPTTHCEHGKLKDMKLTRCGDKVACEQALRGALVAGREKKESLQSRLSSSFPSPTPVTPRQPREACSLARNKDDYAGD